MDQFSLIFDIIILAAGGYLLYVWFRLKREGGLFDNQLLVPRDSKPADCLDPEGYIAYFSPKILILGIVCFVVGLVCVLETSMDLFTKLFPQVEKLSYYMDVGGNLLSLAVLIWYMVCWTKARKEYWV